MLVLETNGFSGNCSKLYSGKKFNGHFVALQVKQLNGNQCGEIYTPTPDTFLSFLFPPSWILSLFISIFSSQPFLVRLFFYHLLQQTLQQGASFSLFVTVSFHIKTVNRFHLSEFKIFCVRNAKFYVIREIF